MIQQVVFNYGIGKKKPWMTLRKNVQGSPNWKMNCHCHLIFPRHVVFICALYSSAKMPESAADQLRYWMFCQKNQKSESLPPTTDSLHHHIERCITQHWYGSGPWMQCKPYKHLLVTDGSYKVKTRKSSKCQMNLPRRDC